MLVIQDLPQPCFQPPIISIEDIRAAASVAKGRKVASHVYAMVVPGSGLVKAQAEAEGLDKMNHAWVNHAFVSAGTYSDAPLH